MRLNSGNACYHSVQNLLSSDLLSKNVKVRIYKTIILPVVLYGCETWSLTVREEHKPRMFENRVLRRIFGPKRDELRYKCLPVVCTVVTQIKPRPPPDGSIMFLRNVGSNVPYTRRDTRGVRAGKSHKCGSRCWCWRWCWCWCWCVCPCSCVVVSVQTLHL
jgi:hypothetical protein